MHMRITTETVEAVTTVIARMWMFVDVFDGDEDAGQTTESLSDSESCISDRTSAMYKLTMNNE